MGERFFIGQHKIRYVISPLDIPSEPVKSHVLREMIFETWKQTVGQHEITICNRDRLSTFVDHLCVFYKKRNCNFTRRKNGWIYSSSKQISSTNVIALLLLTQQKWTRYNSPVIISFKFSRHAAILQPQNAQKKTSLIFHNEYSDVTRIVEIIHSSAQNTLCICMYVYILTKYLFSKTDSAVVKDRTWFARCRPSAYPSCNPSL